MGLDECTQENPQFDFVQILRVVLEISRRWLESPGHGFATVCDYIYSCASHFIFY